MEGIKPLLAAKAWEADDAYLRGFVNLMKERASFYPDLLEKGYYFFEDVSSYDEKMIRKKWKEKSEMALDEYVKVLLENEHFKAEGLESITKQFLEEKGLTFGDLFPMLRICLSGSTKGPSVFEMMELMGKTKVLQRIEQGVDKFKSQAG